MTYAQLHNAQEQYHNGLISLATFQDVVFDMRDDVTEAWAVASDEKEIDRLNKLAYALDEHIRKWN